MKLSTLVSLAAAIVGASAASITDGLPSCAKGCVNQFVGTGSTSIAGCSSIDVACVCSNTSFIGDLACCLAGACDAADQKSAVQFAAQICSSAGVKTPDQVTCDKPGNATASPSASAGPTAGGKPKPNSTAAAGSTKPTSGASSVFVGAGGFIGAAAAVMVLAM